MKWFRSLAVATLFVWSICQVAFAQQNLEFQFAYRPSAFEAFQKNIDRVSIVSPEPFIVDASGVIYGELEPKLVKLAKEHNVKIMPQVKNINPKEGLFSYEWVHSILNDKKVRERTISGMLEICKRYGLWGIQIDFENVLINDREALTSFYREASDALHKEGFKISIAAVHRAEESAGPNTYTQWMMKDWRGAYDLKALGQIGDFVKIMSYGQHTRRTTPGPSQGLPWLEQVLKYFLQYVPPAKLSLGITMGGSLYSTVADTALYYQNARSWSRGISLGEAQSLIEEYGGPPLQWDDKQKVFYGYIERGGVFEWFMIDNELRSLDAKLDLVKKYEIRAINMWVSGRENPGLWDRVRDFKR
ncbi:MAG: glycosyl hydrolase family 18 protein [Ignavibacteria bacterium]|nr:glycosyl hydrolase family 18 protein [Ignavibacteria bacterium]